MRSAAEFSDRMACSNVIRRGNLVSIKSIGYVEENHNLEHFDDLLGLIYHDEIWQRLTLSPGTPPVEIPRMSLWV